MSNSLQLSAKEEQMVEEIFHVLSKYDSLERKFGVHLIHSHFPIGNNEVLLENHSKIKRTLKITPISRENISADALATSWRQNKQGKIEIDMFCCDDGGSDTDVDPT